VVRFPEVALMGLFCWHVWETPAYNAALNLPEGLRRCAKCGSIKGYRRVVRDPECEEEQQAIRDMQGEVEGPAFNVPGRMAGFWLLLLVVLAFAIFMVMAVVPILMHKIDAVTNDGGFDAPQATFIRLIPLVVGMTPVIAIIGYLVSMFSNRREDESDDVKDDPGSAPIDPATGRRSVRPRAIERRLQR
jgi:hypothetical protein